MKLDMMIQMSLSLSSIQPNNQYETANICIRSWNSILQYYRLSARFAFAFTLFQ